VIQRPVGGAKDLVGTAEPSETKSHGRPINAGNWKWHASIKVHHAPTSGTQCKVMGTLVHPPGSSTTPNWADLLTSGPKPHWQRADVQDNHSGELPTTLNMARRTRSLAWIMIGRIRVPLLFAHCISSRTQKTSPPSHTAFAIFSESRAVAPSFTSDHKLMSSSS
jgi:hypothetical protein